MGGYRDEREGGGGFSRRPFQSTHAERAQSSPIFIVTRAYSRCEAQSAQTTVLSESPQRLVRREGRPCFRFQNSIPIFFEVPRSSMSKRSSTRSLRPDGFYSRIKGPLQEFTSSTSSFRSFIDPGSSDTCDVQPIHAFSLLPTVATASPIARSCIGLDSFRSSRNHLTSSLVWLVVAFLGGFEFDANHDSGSNPSAIRHASHVLAYPYTATRPFSIRMPANNQTFKRIPPRPRVDRARHAR